MKELLSMHAFEYTYKSNMYWKIFFLVGAIQLLYRCETTFLRGVARRVQAGWLDGWLADLLAR